MESLQQRITTNPHQCGGRPCLRGMRIRVADVLQLFAAGLTAEQILAEMPDLEALGAAGIKRVSMGNFPFEFVMKQHEQLSATIRRERRFTALFQ